MSVMCLPLPTPSLKVMQMLSRNKSGKFSQWGQKVLGESSSALQMPIDPKCVMCYTQSEKPLWAFQIHGACAKFRQANFFSQFGKVALRELPPTAFLNLAPWHTISPLSTGLCASHTTLTPPHFRFLENFQVRLSKQSPKLLCRPIAVSLNVMWGHAAQQHQGIVRERGWEYL